MKSLILIRHAKSSWDVPGAEDFDRLLSDRGKADAPEMAKRLLKRDIKIDAFISSPAKRAKKTAQLFAQGLKRKKEEIIYIPELYAAPASVFYEVINGIDPALDTVAIFSHNPGITDFAKGLTDTKVDEMPTCSIFAIQIHTDEWVDFQNAGKEFWFFEYPKLKS